MNASTTQNVADHVNNTSTEVGLLVEAGNVPFSTTSD
jgi:hypothetical protein